MKKLFFLLPLLVLTFACVQNNGAKSDNSKQDAPLALVNFDTIALLAPDTLSGVPLLTAMQNRHSDRQFGSQNLSLRQLSEILWAANGVNRPEKGFRTVPSAMAKFPILCYAFLENGAYYYQPESHKLIPVLEGDYRYLTGMQEFVKTAALNLVFIADYGKYGDRPLPADQRLWFASLDAGHSCQNVYLYCASEGLRSVERAMANGAELLQALQLDENHQFIISQTVGVAP
ncbi:MAG: SagB/ThcOx family dehydrogenase [Paludibacter sp.]|jgi:nitroreductase|nr:SagB/ThcOx family dehydrogenase [Paludibacter sp.]